MKHKARYWLFNGARMVVPKFVCWVACIVTGACQGIFGSYLDHMLDRGGRLCAHRQAKAKASKEHQKITLSTMLKAEGNLGTRIRARNTKSSKKKKKIVKWGLACLAYFFYCFWIHEGREVA